MGDSKQQCCSRRKRSDSRRIGMLLALISGVCYGVYSAFLTQAMGTGQWARWPREGLLSAYALTVLLGILASTINDLLSALWSLLMLLLRGKLGGLVPALRSSSGRILLGAALVGGPLASAAYVIALQQAGSLVIPITALCPVIGTLLDRLFFKQAIRRHMWLGIGICLVASVCIGATGLSLSLAPMRTLLGAGLALFAAFGWGLEGCVAGFATKALDYELGISIRQLTSGLTNLLLLLPLASCFDIRGLALYPDLLQGALSDPPSLAIFALSGFFALFAYSLWYKGNSLCGVALGMACNGSYAFWGPFFCWLLLGVYAGQTGWDLHPLSWLGALLMVLGIFIIAVNPQDYLRKLRRRA